MSYDCHGVLLIFALLLTPAAGCTSISQQNSTYGRVTNLNIHRDELPSSLNSSCSWVINNAAGDSYSYYMISLRQIEVERQWSSSTHELVFISEQQQIVLKDINQRSLYIPSAGKLRIELRHKSQPNSLNVRHFAIEYLFVNPSTVTADQFRCSKSGVIIPAAWKCNCLNECLLDDASDEESCPLCALAKPFDSLLCHAGEDWCLPTNRSTTEMDPKGVCVPNAPSSQCTYSAKCEIIFVYRQNYGDIALSNALLDGRQSLCLIVVAEPKHKIKLALTQYSFADQRPDLEYSVYDGSEEQSRLLTSSNWLSTKQVVQTYQHHVATISIRKRALADDVIPSDTLSAYRNSILLNITWFTSLCPEDEMVCGGHFEAKCYTKQQRCDGIWDCISGDDELGCAPSSCPTTFSCNDQLRLPSDRPRCYTWYERCNGNAFCANRTDEKNCTSWWCNSDNGTFLCRNRNCIYEIWACDGTDDCGDNSDEINCPSRVPRRIVTAAVIGATVCSTLFIIALACTCKLFHMRSAERRASYRLLNPQRYIEQRREELQRRSSRHSSSNDESTVVPEDTRRVAPPSYNQTMGFCDDTEERQAFLAEHLRLAGLSNLIPSLNLESSSRTSRHRSRRHRRYRRHQRSRRAESEHSRVALLDPFVTHSAPPAPPPPPSTARSAGRFDRWRSQFRSLFAGNLSVNSNDIAASDLDAREQRTSSPPIVLTTRPCVQSCELPPPYADDHLLSSRHDSNGQPLTSAPSTAPTFRLIRIRKHQVPLDTFQNQSEQQAPQQTSSSPPTATIDDDEQASSDDDKLLVP